MADLRQIAGLRPGAVSPVWLQAPDPTQQTSTEGALALQAEAAHQRRRARRNRAVARAGRRGRVLVVDDSEAFRHAAASLVSTAHELRLVGEAASGEEAIERLDDAKPDLVLLDLRMSGIDGLETAGIIGRVRPQTVVVLVSAEAGDFEEAAGSAGVAALLNKQDLRPRMLDELWLEHRPRD